VIDQKNINGRFARFQFQTQLFLQRSKERGYKLVPICLM
jgi:hypothetical protein